MPNRTFFSPNKIYVYKLDSPKYYLHYCWNIEVSKRENRRKEKKKKLPQ